MPPSPRRDRSCFRARCRSQLHRAAQIPVRPRWEFDRLGVIPFAAPMNLVSLYVGTHEAETQHLANRFHPCRTFNLSITPAAEIAETQRRMEACYHPDGRPWLREYMPRTVLVFLEDDDVSTDAELDERARLRAEATIKAYWVAMEGTLREDAVQKAVNNALWGSPNTIRNNMAQT